MVPGIAVGFGDLMTKKEIEGEAGVPEGEGRGSCLAHERRRAPAQWRKDMGRWRLWLRERTNRPPKRGNGHARDGHVRPR